MLALVGNIFNRLFVGINARTRTQEVAIANLSFLPPHIKFID